MNGRRERSREGKDGREDVARGEKARDGGRILYNLKERRKGREDGRDNVAKRGNIMRDVRGGR